jgi:fumarate hydratase class II
MIAKISKVATSFVDSKEGLDLKTAALELGFLTSSEYDQWVIPLDMTHS